MNIKPGQKFQFTQTKRVVTVVEVNDRFVHYTFDAPQTDDHGHPGGSTTPWIMKRRGFVKNVTPAIVATAMAKVQARIDACPDAPGHRFYPLASGGKITAMKCVECPKTVRKEDLAQGESLPPKWKGFSQ